MTLAHNNDDDARTFARVVSCVSTSIIDVDAFIIDDDDDDAHAIARQYIASHRVTL